MANISHLEFDPHARTDKEIFVAQIRMKAKSSEISNDIECNAWE